MLILSVQQCIILEHYYIIFVHPYDISHMVYVNSHRNMSSFLLHKSYTVNFPVPKLQSY
uniref:Uncharacterized protein n=1 Tax=Anguilla anguilla TaxID=7936 RepID=A0A0E9WJ77_ANGAN